MDAEKANEQRRAAEKNLLPALFGDQFIHNKYTSMLVSGRF